MNSPLYVSYFLFLSFILFFFYPLLLSFSLSFFMSLHLGHMHSAIRGQSKLFLCNIRPRTLKSSSVLFISPQFISTNKLMSNIQLMILNEYLRTLLQTMSLFRAILRQRATLAAASPSPLPVPTSLTFTLLRR